MKRYFLTSVVFLGAACAHTIEGTQVSDTRQNRELVDIIRKVESAMEARNAAGILEYVSPNYFEDMGTTAATDDFGYGQLRDKILPESLAATNEMHIQIQVQEIQVEGDRAYADVRYSSRAQIQLPTGPLWDTRNELNRIEFAKEGDFWKITAGL